VTAPSFAAQKKPWSSPPVDDIGYLPAADLLAMDDHEFCSVMRKMEVNRYDGWRNLRNRWINTLRIDDTHDKRVLDYGCGVGVEALQFAPSNRVWVADIVRDNLNVAARLFALSDYDLAGALLIQGAPPFIKTTEKFDPDNAFDVIHCSGVLHHIVDPVPVVKAMAGWLAEGGELRLMLYSDKAWFAATGEWPPPHDISRHPQRERFVRHYDAVGDWADWYNQQRLVDRFGEWFRVVDYQPITRSGEYVGAVLVKR
jgi:SAM-dependent methyltransferase